MFGPAKTLIGWSTREIVEAIMADCREPAEVHSRLGKAIRDAAPPLGEESRRMTLTQRVVRRLNGKPEGMARSQIMATLRVTAGEMDLAIESDGQSEFWVVNYWNAGKRAQRLFAKDYMDEAQAFFEEVSGDD